MVGGDTRQRNNGPGIPKGVPGPSKLAILMNEMNQNNTILGVGPHSKPWPVDNRLDPELLKNGDTRNVEDKYRYWKVEAIVADLDTSRSSLHIAIENWQHDFNIGTIVRSSNAFNVAAVHIIGKKHWNRRGAMVTDRYLHIFHHVTVADFVKAMNGYHVIAVDNQPSAINLSEVDFPEKAVLVFGGEGPGISAEMQAACETMVQIEQFGSTRSVNVGVAAGIVMYQWVRQHILK